MEVAPRFVVLAPEHVGAASQCITDQFKEGEPMSTTRGIGSDGFIGFARIHCERAASKAVSSGLSTVCLIGDDVAAVVISEDLLNPLVPESDPFYAPGNAEFDLDKWTPILALLGEMDENFLKNSEHEHKEGELFHQFLVAVSPKFQRRGLCAKVLTENLAMATKKGFKRSVIECTGKFSNAAAVKLGSKLFRASLKIHLPSAKVKLLRRCKPTMSPRVVALLAAFGLRGALATPMCCWSKWGDSNTCGDYNGSGAQCNTDHSKTCASNSDCPATPVPPPTPSPPTPSPPTPPTPTPPTPPTPTPPTPPSPPSPGPSPPYTPVAMPSKMLGMYVLVADDTDKVYTSTHAWTPQLFPYQQTGSNVIYLTFLNPKLMPAVPPAMAALAKTRGSGKPGAVPAGTAILFAIGGQAYSQGESWDWLTSTAKAEAMAAEVAKWPEKYGCDGIDLDIETGAGNVKGVGATLAAFVGKLKELAPKMIITQPVFGSPSSVPAANRMIEASYNKTLKNPAYGSLSKVGIMIYSGTGSEQWTKYYTDGCSQYCTQWNCNLAACVPKGDMVLGIDGSAAAGSITQIASDVKSQGLGGVMVWETSALDAATGKRGLVYGPMDASITKLGAWSTALKTMTSGDQSVLLV